jgi:hypothetical protein
VNHKLSLAELVERRVVHTIGTYSRTVMTGLEVPSIPNTSLDNIAALLCLIGLGAAGLFLLWRRGDRLPALYVVCYAGMLTIYPWKVGRFLIPLLPILLLAVLVAVAHLTRRKGAIGTAVACGLVVLPLMLHSATILAARIPGAQACRDVDVVRTEGCLTPTARAYMEVTRYAADSLPKSAVVTTVKEAVFHLHTGLTTFHPGRVGKRSGTEMLAFMRGKGVEYLMLSNYPDGNTIAPAIGDGCRELELLTQASPQTFLFRLRPADTVASASSACDAVASSAAMYEQRRHSQSATDEIGPEGGEQ